MTTAQECGKFVSLTHRPQSEGIIRRIERKIEDVLGRISVWI
jgi:hypothetical protein